MVFKEEYPYTYTQTQSRNFHKNATSGKEMCRPVTRNARLKGNTVP